jgi:hypothetical protein
MLKKIKAFDWERIWRLFCGLTFLGETIAFLIHPNITHAFVALGFLVIITGQTLEDEIAERRTINIDNQVHLHQYVCVDEEGKPLVIARSKPLKTS